MSREFFVPCQPYAYPLRSRLSSSNVGNRLKSLVRWKEMKLRASKQPTTTTTTSASSFEDISLSATTTATSVATVVDSTVESAISEAAGNRLTNETSRIIEEDNNPTSSSLSRNLIESNLVSSTFDPTMSSSFVTAYSSLPSHEGEDREVTSSNYVEASNSTTNASDSSNLSENTDDEVNPINGQDSLGLPSAVIGVQLQTATSSMGARILDVIPILFIQNGGSLTLGNSTSATTEESFTSNSTTGSSAEDSSNASMSSSASAVIEIVTPMEESARRFEREYVRPYYDLNYRPTCGTGSSEGVVGVNGVVEGGMECMPLRPGPFHYLISEQAKSLVALQELQNEVGALLEFRDLVIETFPNLRHKMAVTASAHNNSTSPTTNGAASVLMSSGQGSHVPMPLSSQSPSSRRIGEWEPGKVRRRVAQSRDNNNESSSLPRSRSNSHSGGNKHSATVQDSGFSTETSSKDSASTAIPRPQSPNSRPVLDEAEDELWNLLDVIHRKGVRLREEVESLQGRLESVAPEDLEDVPSDILDAVRKVSRDSDDQEDDERHHHHHHHRLDSRDEDLLLIDDEGCSQLAVLRREKLQLLDKVAELEAETISSRARAQELQSELAALSALKTGLEDRLRAGLEGEDGGILAPAVQRLQPIEPTAPTNLALQSPRGSGNALNIRSKDSAFASVVSGDISNKAHKNRFRTRTIEKNVLACVAVSRSIEDVAAAVAASGDKLSTSSVDERRKRLGALDSVLISPKRLPLSMQQMRRSDVDAHKIAAILRERSPLELQRHLITTTVHNQALQKRLDAIQKSTETLSERLGKANEENEDLRFQLAERNIELEGTRARMRVLERLQQRPATENDADDESEPLQNGHHLQNGFDAGSSSADSSRDTLHTPHNTSSESQSPLKPSPRRRPSRIPLPGAIKATAPKPPITSTPNNSNLQHRRNDSKDSLRSLKSNNNLSITSSRLCAAKVAARDSGRDSLSKSTSGAVREPTSRSLPRNSSRDSLGKSSLSRTRDSLESNGSQTPPRRPPAPARRSHSQAPRPEQSPATTNIQPQNDTAKSMQSSNPPSSWLSSGVSLYPDSLNSINNVPNEEEDDETSSRTASTRVEFIIGSPTRKRIFKTPWSVPEYFDSIDTEGMMHDNLESEEYQYEGEALAECDSLECDDRLESDS